MDISTSVVITLAGFLCTIASVWGVMRYQTAGLVSDVRGLSTTSAGHGGRLIALESARTFGERETSRRLDQIENSIERLDDKIERLLGKRDDASSHNRRETD